MSKKKAGNNYTVSQVKKIYSKTVGARSQRKAKFFGVLAGIGISQFLSLKPCLRKGLSGRRYFG